MPSLGSHLKRARIVADRLDLPEIEADRGAFYLGATAPDIRVITRLDREVTHFFRLSELGAQDSVARMFREHPGLQAPSGLDAATTAFVAGYLTHLVLDESFIGEIYRPHFGAFSDRDGDPKANVLDRALQYELDRRDREDSGMMEEIRAAIARTAPVQGIPFIQDQHLVEWAIVSEDVAAQPADYSRFRRMMMRHLQTAGYDEATIERECEAPTDLVQEAFAIVSEERINRFWRDAQDQMTERVRGYLR
ncbi:MAG: zinc dependent phospholipase C family protein [Dehalococcoidia bacterium]|nr:zinc dependent phospholipase C family protein [Dehalococcoidia bacterium]